MVNNKIFHFMFYKEKQYVKLDQMLFLHQEIRLI